MVVGFLLSGKRVVLLLLKIGHFLLCGHRFRYSALKRAFRSSSGHQFRYLAKSSRFSAYLPDLADRMFVTLAKSLIFTQIADHMSVKFFLRTSVPPTIIDQPFE
ncbi:MAG TPA: hypothetical protein VFH42_05025 [Sporolactobacillaceae bacterium]|nr:hypothetical protein [Sporolactobacillaceae bacterium]